MNIFQKIKIALLLKSFEENVEKEAFTMNGVKPGWKTSEFWLNVMVQAGTIWGSVQGFVPPKYAAIVSAVGTAVYTIVRTLAKS